MVPKTKFWVREKAENGTKNKVLYDVDKLTLHLS
jgi:hypothetical protein